MGETERIVKYGVTMPAGWNLLDVELWAFRTAKPYPATLHLDTGEVATLLSKQDHFKRIVGAIWPAKLPNGKDNPKYFEFHPLADKMLDEACRERFLGVAGAGSTGKTRFFAMWAIVNFICSPRDTLVMVVSTSLKDARDRIWGAIEEYWNAAPGLPGTLVSSQGLIRFEVPGRANADVLSGLRLVAGDKSKAKEAASNLIGKKNKRLFLIADEHTELAHAINEAFFGNLILNDGSQFVGLANTKSRYDAFGDFIEPADGWDSINSESDEWRTKWQGKCIRLDGLKSPNWLAGRNIYKYLIKVEDIQRAMDTYGVNSPMFWRMYRGYFCPTNTEQTVFSEADIVKFGGDKGVTWQSEPVDLAALDPAFTTGGDESALYFGKYGQEAVTGRNVLLLTDVVSLDSDVADKDTPRNFQIAAKFKAECVKRKIPPENAALDSTNIPFADIVSSVWSNKVWRTYFGGKATDRPMSEFSPQPASERYANRVTELWHSGMEFLKNNQLRGIGRVLAQELCSRQTSESGKKVQVESKRDMKARLGASPDKSDAAMILVDLVRERFRGGLRKKGAGGKSSWLRAALTADVSSGREL